MILLVGENGGTAERAGGAKTDLNPSLPYCEFTGECLKLQNQVISVKESYLEILSK